MRRPKRSSARRARALRVVLDGKLEEIVYSTIVAFELELERARAEERRPEGLVARKVCVVDARESGDFMEEVEVCA